MQEAAKRARLHADGLDVMKLKRTCGHDWLAQWAILAYGRAGK